MYSYDALGRLIDAKAGTYSGGTIATPTFKQTWGLDQLGNWSTFKQDDDGTGWGLEQYRLHNSVNEIDSDDNDANSPEDGITATTGPDWCDPAYDKAGNMAGGPSALEPIDCQAFVYDAWNRLVKVLNGAGTTTFQKNHYDGRNHRIMRDTYTSGSLTETRHYYYNDQWQVVEEQVEVSGGTRVDAQWVYHPHYVDAPALRYWDSDPATNPGPDKLHYYLQDANYNVTALVNGDPASGNLGKVVERYAYTPYGKATVLNGAADANSGVSDWSNDANQASDVNNVVLYTGRELDAGTGLQLNRHRYYSCTIGRWVTRDPIGYFSGSISLYECGGTSPTKGVDPSGLAAVETCTCYWGRPTDQEPVVLFSARLRVNHNCKTKPCCSGEGSPSFDFIASHIGYDRNNFLRGLNFELIGCGNDSVPLRKLFGQSDTIYAQMSCGIDQSANCEKGFNSGAFIIRSQFSRVGFLQFDWTISSEACGKWDVHLTVQALGGALEEHENPRCTCGEYGIEPPPAWRE